MLRLRWGALLVPVLAAAVLGGCSSNVPGETRPTDGPAGQNPDSITGALPAGITGPVQNVPALCGIQGVFWQNNWWVVDPPIQAARTPSPVTVASGTMTTIGNNEARFDSPDLNAPQILSMTYGHVTPNAPPFVECDPQNT